MLLENAEIKNVNIMGYLDRQKAAATFAWINSGRQCIDSQKSVKKKKTIQRRKENSHGHWSESVKFCLLADVLF